MRHVSQKKGRLQAFMQPPYVCRDILIRYDLSSRTEEMPDRTA